MRRTDEGHAGHPIRVAQRKQRGDRAAHRVARQVRTRQAQRVQPCGETFGVRRIVVGLSLEPIAFAKPGRSGAMTRWLPVSGRAKSTQWSLFGEDAVQ
jgi:hypothetical protein